MGYSYDSIPTYQGELYEACVNKTMELLNFQGSIHTGWEGMNQVGTPLKITAIGGAYEGSVFVSGGQVTNAITGAQELYVFSPQGLPFDDVASMVKWYGDTINSMFVDWTSLPDPDDFAGPIAQLRTAAEKLTIDDDFGGSKYAAPLGRNKELDGNVTSITDKIGNMSGLAMNTFGNEWCNQLPKTLACQATVVRTLYGTIAGEKEVWTRAKQVVADIAGKGVEAAKSANGQGPGGGLDGLDVLLSVAGAVALIAAPFTDGASLAVVGGLNAIGVIAQTSADFVPEPAEPEKKGLDSGHPVGVLYNMQEALDALNTQISNEEKGIQKAMGKYLSFIGANSDSFAIKTPDLIYDDNKGDYLAINKFDLHQVATEWMRENGECYAAASTALDSADGSGPWSRPGSIGVGATGPYPDWSKLRNDVSPYVARLYTQNEQSRAALAIVARDFGRTDDQIETDLQAQTAKIEAAGRTAGH